MRRRVPLSVRGDGGLRRCRTVRRAPAACHRVFRGVPPGYGGLPAGGRMRRRVPLSARALPRPVRCRKRYGRAIGARPRSGSGARSAGFGAWARLPRPGVRGSELGGSTSGVRSRPCARPCAGLRLGSCVRLSAGALPGPCVGCPPWHRPDCASGRAGLRFGSVSGCSPRHCPKPCVRLSARALPGPRARLCAGPRARVVPLSRPCPGIALGLRPRRAPRPDRAGRRAPFQATRRRPAALGAGVSGGGVSPSPARAPASRARPPVRAAPRPASPAAARCGSSPSSPTGTDGRRSRGSSSPPR